MAEDRKRQCFVIGPIGDEESDERLHADWLYQGIICPTFQNDFPDWTVERADKISTPGMVSSQIINRLHDVELVIADLSFHNANAFYEMSIRHQVGRPIIHMIRKAEKIPFDVIPHRAIPFSHARPDDLEEARKQLKLSIAEAVKPGFKPDNPISHARGKLKLEQTATPEMKVLVDELATMRARLDRVETAIHSHAGWARGESRSSPFSESLLRAFALDPMTPEQLNMVYALARGPRRSSLPEAEAPSETGRMTTATSKSE